MSRPLTTSPIEVLLVEDDANDIELTLRALQGAKLRNVQRTPMRSSGISISARIASFGDWPALGETLSARQTAVPPKRLPARSA